MAVPLIFIENNLVDRHLADKVTSLRLISSGWVIDTYMFSTKNMWRQLNLSWLIYTMTTTLLIQTKLIKLNTMDITYNDFACNIEKCNITYMFYLLLKPFISKISYK